jgi:CheY-like chemotaxis protein
MTRKFGGTGLGLFLSRRLANLLGGDVTLGPSRLGQGSEFLITVGVEIRGQKVSTGKSQPKEVVGEAATRPHGKILIVDDAPDNRTLIELYLTRLGFESDTAATGREAVDKALHQPYEVILMDVQMPEMDGFEAVHELRAHNYRGPIVALTAHAMKGDRELCLAEGFDDYLGKPIDRELLKKSLYRFTTH